VCRTRASSPAVAPPDADAALRNVITSLRFVELPLAEALALLGEVCKPVAESEPCPDELAVLMNVITSSRPECPPRPVPLAVRGDVCNQVAWSPTVAPPVAEAVLMNPIISLRFVEPPVPEPVAALTTV
jgi:hypothetical protein